MRRSCGFPSLGSYSGARHAVNSVSTTEPALPVRKSGSLDGKAGLLVALIQNRVSRQAADWGHHPPMTGKFADDFIQLVEWAVDRVWEDRDFLKMMVPRALLDPTIGKLLGEVGASRPDAVVIERLKRFGEPNR